MTKAKRTARRVNTRLLCNSPRKERKQIHEAWQGFEWSAQVTKTSYHPNRATQKEVTFSPMVTQALESKSLGGLRDTDGSFRQKRATTVANILTQIYKKNKSKGASGLTQC